MQRGQKIEASLSFVFLYKFGEYEVLLIDILKAVDTSQSSKRIRSLYDEIGSNL
jgi:hypothetical protein